MAVLLARITSSSADLMTVDATKRSGFGRVQSNSCTARLQRRMCLPQARAAGQRRDSGAPAKIREEDVELPTAFRRQSFVAFQTVRNPNGSSRNVTRDPASQLPR